MTDIWEIYHKPSPLRCPRHLCFFWREVGTHAASGMYPSLSDALNHIEYVRESHCGCDYGRCIRLDPVHGDKDWYEPDELALERAGLPWFYFIPTPNSLVDEAQATYMLESERLWGREHWKK